MLPRRRSPAREERFRDEITGRLSLSSVAREWRLAAANLFDGEWVAGETLEGSQAAGDLGAPGGASLLSAAW